jgi:hypothetical protein
MRPARPGSRPFEDDQDFRRFASTAKLADKFAVTQRHRAAPRPDLDVAVLFCESCPFDKRAAYAS